ncbi:uncharacterized membrane protein YidH (DUF202 family) [Actinoalloteichus hoggarensis]|uniref:DUF202 domain-containing protein n=1 Tax=Actinoalloteichus hoggarensis TaxID=1470176 RepID=A0A221W966_9PSEU|nr:DUF202 domain-containing protein [Actinoalloteichus hoggarensis]ASO22425.1 hypothetical protein AHOG_24095 [Actinoalloteichus hoggarensis]MBB5923151.1 uncharacterized membrane protein YidH (DUF202 family) [Actinoalloteichus hoggarensis]
MTTNGRDAVWDLAQAERTALSWRRTALAFVILALALVRLVAGVGVPAASVLAVLCAAGVGGLLMLTLRRYRRTTERLHRSEPLPSGRLPLLFTLATVLLGMLALGWVILV